MCQNLSKIPAILVKNLKLFWQLSDHSIHLFYSSIIGTNTEFERWSWEGGGGGGGMYKQF